MSEHRGAPAPLRLLAGVLLPARDREFIMGDLDELYLRRTAREGRGSATRRYLRDALLSAAARFFGRRRHRRAARPAGPRRRDPTVAGSALLMDVRWALRTLRRERGFAALVVLTLALGIGSTSAVFGMVNQLLLRPLAGAAHSPSAAYLQFHSPERPEGTNGHGLAQPDFDALRRETDWLAGIASYGLVGLRVSVDDARPVAVLGNAIYGDLFEVLGVRPSAGRLLAAAETEIDAEPLQAVIAGELAGTLFGSAAAAVGRTIRMNEHDVRVVGVAGGGFRGPERGVDTDVWLPLPALVPLVGFSVDQLRSRRSTMHNDIVLRPRPGVAPEAVETRVGQLVGRLAAEADGELGPYLEKLRPRVYPGLTTPPIVRRITQRSLRTLSGVVAVVLLIACANVANLLLFRNVERRGSVAMRRALGASSMQVARQHLAQSLVLAVLGTLGGLGVGWLVALPFRGARLTRMPAFEGLALDGRTLLFAAVVAGATALLFGTVPALLAGRSDPASALRLARGRDTGRSGRLRSALSVGQLALSLSLVVGALLLTRTVHALYAADTGLAIDGVSALWVDGPRIENEAERDALHRSVLAAVQAIPDVEGAGLDVHGPHGSRLMGSIGLPETADAELARAQMIPVTPGWFGLLGMQPVNGRTFRDTDWRVGAQAGVVLTASLARRLFGHEQVAGRHVRAGFRDPVELEVAGVVADFSTAWAPDEPEDAFFVTWADASTLGYAADRFTLLTRTRAFDASVAERVRRAVETILPDVPIPDPEPLSARVGDIHEERRLFSRLLGLLSAVAVVLAAVGLYGVAAFGVAGRRREFGVRMALGAEAARLARIVLADAAVLVTAGTALGLGGAWVLSEALRSRLFGVAPLDPASWLGAALLLAAVAAVACWIPAWRAMRVDPAVTLRDE